MSRSIKLYDVLIIGGGPAGLTAGIYSGRARLKTKVVAGPTPGGQIALTYRVDNYPGFYEPATGPELVEKLIKHATGFGVELDKREAESVDLSSRPYKITIGGELVETKTLIIASGSKNRKLGLESEKRLTGRGVFVCATCDAALYEGLRVVVVGGGDSAIQEALDLSRFASDIIVVHRGRKLTACPCIQARAREEPKISFMLNMVVKEILGEKSVESIKLMDEKSGEEKIVKTDGLLIAIGWDPNTDLYEGQLKLDKNGYIISDGVKTDKPGVFVAGDVDDKVYRQVVTACGSGCKAALEAEWFIARDSQ